MDLLKRADRLPGPHLATSYRVMVMLCSNSEG